MNGFLNTENTELKGADSADESFDQIDLKIDKEEIITKDDFYSNPNVINKKINRVIVLIVSFVINSLINSCYF